MKQCFLLFIILLSHSCLQAMTKNVLVIHSFHESLPWTRNVSQGIENVFSQSDLEIETFTEYLDVNRWQKERAIQNFHTYLKQKYQRKELDLVLVSDNAALEFWTQYQQQNQDNTPVVFCGINNFSHKLLGNVQRITGIPEHIDVKKTIEFIQRIRPQTKKLLIINDKSETGRILNEFLLHVLPKTNGISFELEHNTNRAYLEKKLSSLSENTAILLFSSYTDHLNDWLSTKEFVQTITTIAKVPIFTFWDNIFTYGTTGGMIVSGEHHGQMAALYGVKVLKGKPINDIPILDKSPNVFILDEASIEKFGLKNIPDETIITNQKISLFREYKAYIISFLSAFIVLVILTIYLFLNMLNRKKMEKKLKESEKKFRSAYYDSNIGMAILDADGFFIEANTILQNTLGYSVHEIITKSFYDFVINEDANGKQNTSFFNESLTHTFENKYKKKNGEICIALTTISPILDENGVVKYAILHLQDITQHVLDKENMIKSTKRFSQLFHKSPAPTWELGLNKAFTFIQKIYQEQNQNTYHYLDENRDILRTCVEKMEVLDVNEAALKMFKVNAKVVFYEHFVDIIDIQFGDFIIAAIVQILEGKTILQGEARIKTFYGNYVNVLTHIALIPEKNNMKALITMLDVTKQKIALEELKKSKERFSLAVDASKDGLWDYNLANDTIYYSPNLIQLIGENNLCKSKDCFITTHTKPSKREKIQKILQQTIADKKHNLELEIELKIAENNYIPVLTRTKLIYDENGKLTRMVGTIIDLSEHYKLTNAYKMEKEKTQLYLDIVDVILMVVDKDGKIVMLNPKGCEITGYSKEEITGKNWFDTCLRKDDKSKIRAVINQILEQKINVKNKLYENKIVCKDGHEETIRWRVVLIKNANDEVEHLLCSGENITKQIEQEKHQKQLEQQLMQSQKMESIGRLAGGVAHDFNNMLSVILGYSDIALSQLSEESNIYEDIVEIKDAAVRSSELTKQLLAFARKQAILPKVLDLNSNIESMLKMLRRVIGENINLQWIPTKKKTTVWMDSSQVNQILANLCVNARDAILHDGQINISTEVIDIEESKLSEKPHFIVGKFIRLSVEDNGCGMDKDTRVKIFEPFFTTKEEGKGTGLGLATIYGIVQQNNGFIDVASTIGLGTKFDIYIPFSKKEVIEKRKTIDAFLAGSEKILIVEDNTTVLNVTKKILTKQGYQVIGIASPTEALATLELYHGKFDLILTDIMMPEMNGKELTIKIHKKYPTLKILWMSGYTADILDEKAGVDGQIDMLKKPFTPAELIEKIQHLLK